VDGSNAVEEIREFAPEVLLLDFYIPPFTGLEVRPGAEAASRAASWRG
jgi:response regulator of citrate/malate metabolism